MVNLSTKYLGLELKNPIIVSSSGLTGKYENLEKIEKHGAGAIVLKSLFEEQIRYEGNKAYLESGLANQYPEAEDYIMNYIKSNKVDAYLDMIKNAKKNLSIPIIASINCISAEEWTEFATRIENAGAAAIELNVFAMPLNPNKTGKEYEAIYFEILEKIKQKTSIPISLKLSSYFSGFAEFAQKLSWAGVKGLVLFNRFFSPDIDLEKMKIIPANIFSKPEEFSNTLRWVAMLSDVVQCDIAASTGVHNGTAAIKQILAGASAVQICSILYEKGLEYIETILKDMNTWMKNNNYSDIKEIKGKMSFKKAKDATTYSRAQFIKHFSGIE